MAPRTFVFAGGGSGGHLFPGVAVAEELAARDRNCRIVFVGSERGIERLVLAETTWRHVALSVQPPGTAARHPLRFAHRFVASLRAALRLIDELRPDAVIGLGGFASLPVGIAALRQRTPLVLLEQNVVPGRATSWLSRFADRVCVSFEETVSLLPRKVNAVVTGNPLRAAFRRAARGRTRRPSLLILGGSQGALSLNRMAIEALPRIAERLVGWRIVHQAGERDLDAVREAYARTELDAIVEPFFADLPSRYASARIAVSRAGATSLAELACVGCPAILVPYPGAVRDHQSCNAEHYAALGGAIVIPESTAATDRLADALTGLFADPGRLATMSRAMFRAAKPDAAARVADFLLPRSAAARAA